MNQIAQSVSNQIGGNCVAGNKLSLRRMVSRSLKAALLPAALLIAFAPAANAATATTSFQVTATVIKACLITTPSTLAFGTYDPGSASPLASTTTFNVTCTAGTPYSLGLSAGTSSGASVTNRRLTSPSAAAGANTLSYGLFKDAAHTVNWDNSVSATGYAGTGAAQPLTVYGQIPINQYTAAPATDYADTITVTLTY